MIDNFGKVEIEWEEKCVKCKKKKKKHYKEIYIANINEYLFISLQRFNIISNEVNNIKVKFEESIDIKELIDRDIYKGSNRFDLIAIINHLRTIEYGYYFCFIKLDSKWIKYDDIMVEEIEDIDNNSSNPCILLYKRH